jgi:hypothetical protein
VNKQGEIIIAINWFLGSARLPYSEVVVDEVE